MLTRKAKKDKRQGKSAAVIGAGFTGLTAAYTLASAGFKVYVFEMSDYPGGLAVGFKSSGWNWFLEQHYHHLFTSDKDILSLAKEVGHKVIFQRAKTASFYKNEILQIDSALSLLSFKHLSFFSRLRTGVILFFLKINPFWQPLEKISVKRFIKASMGEESWKVLWKTLLFKKFGKHAGSIPASWFWARIKTRSAKLGYPVGGFKKLGDSMVRCIVKRGGKVFFSKQVIQIRAEKRKIILKTDDSKEFIFDKAICTLPTNVFLKITKGLPQDYRQKLGSMQGIGVVNLVLELKERFLKDGTYWLNITHPNFPFLCIVEHTNFITPNQYGKKRILYIGQYLDDKDKYFRYSANELFEAYFPYLCLINPDFKRKLVSKKWLFKTAFAQPILELNYSKKLPPFQTPIPGVYLANMQQVYPWDRGTNYAVKLGKSVARRIIEEEEQY